MPQFLQDGNTNKPCAAREFLVSQFAILGPPRLPFVLCRSHCLPFPSALWFPSHRHHPIECPRQGPGVSGAGRAWANEGIRAASRFDALHRAQRRRDANLPFSIRLGNITSQTRIQDASRPADTLLQTRTHREGTHPPFPRPPSQPIRYRCAPIPQPPKATPPSEHQRPSRSRIPRSGHGQPTRASRGRPWELPAPTHTTHTLHTLLDLHKVQGTSEEPGHLPAHRPFAQSTAPTVCLEYLVLRSPAPPAHTAHDAGLGGIYRYLPLPCTFVCPFSPLLISAPLFVCPSLFHMSKLTPGLIVILSCSSPQQARSRRNLER